MNRRHFGRWMTWWLPLLLAVATVAGNSSAQEPKAESSGPQKNYPLGLAIAADGTIYFADRNLPGVLMLKDGSVSVYFAGSKKFRTPLNAVRCLAMDAQGRLLAGDTSTRQVYRFDESGQPQPVVPFVGENLGPFGTPMGLALNSKGDLFISDREFRCIWLVAAEGGNARKFVDIQGPGGIFIDANDEVWITSLVDNPLRRFSTEAKEEIVVKARPFQYPSSVAVDDTGAAYVVDSYKKTIWKVTAGTEPQSWLTHERLKHPVDIKFANGQLYVVDPRAQVLLKVQLDGTAEVIELTVAGE